MNVFFKNFLGAITLIFGLFFTQVVVAQTAKEWNEKAKKYIETEPQKAYELLLKAQTQKGNSDDLQENIELNISIVKRIQGEFKESIRLSEMVLQKTANTQTKASVYNNLGSAYKRMGENEKAMKNYLSAHELYTQQKNWKDAATVENNIGLLYQALENFPKAKTYHQTALEHFTQLKDQAGISKSYNMLGIVSANEDDLEMALSYFQKSYKIELAQANKVGISEAVNNIGGIYFYMGELDSALVYFKKSLEIDRKNKDYSNLADGMNNIAEVYMNVEDFKNAKLYLDSAMQLAINQKYANAYLLSLETYSYLHELSGDLGKANNYLRRYYAAKDSVAELSNLKNINELETKYQTEKKEKQLLAKEIELKKKSNLIVLTTTLLVAFLIIGFLIYRALKLKNQQQKQEFELKEAISVIDTQNKLQEQRLAISRDLHDNIGAQLTFVISSIDTLKYAFKITDEKINAKLRSISNFTKDTITELRDTIWAMNHDTITFEDIQTRISSFVEKAKIAQENVAFQFEIGAELSHVELSSVVGMNIYRIIQEGINNALKYAEPTQISIIIQMIDNELTITVKDNGKGFDTNETETGNGLRNMKKRADEINATYHFSSKIGEGTEIALIVSNFDFVK